MAQIFNTFYFRHVPISPTLLPLHFPPEDTNSAPTFLFHEYARVWENCKIYYPVLIYSILYSIFFYHLKELHNIKKFLNLLQHKDCVNIEFVNKNTEKYHSCRYISAWMFFNDKFAKQNKNSNLRSEFQLHFLKVI
jgi:hypothetical protein